MPSHLQKAEAPDRAIRRVCREHIAKALFRLRRSRHPATVHVVRKEIKKLRAILRLVHGHTNAGVQEKLEQSLRRAGRQLAASRDARVIFKAFEKLAGRHAKKNYPHLHKALEKHCREESRRFRHDDSSVQATKIFQKAARRLAHLKVKETGWAAFEPGLQQSYRQGEYAAILARAKKSADHYHDWRKHVKTLLYQIRLLCPEWPAVGRSLLTKLDRLGTALGEDHDLALLKDFASNHDRPKEVRPLIRLIQSRQKNLRTIALKLGSQLYREPPTSFTTRLQKPWSAWHAKKTK